MTKALAPPGDGMLTLLIFLHSEQLQIAFQGAGFEGYGTCPKRLTAS